MRGRKQQTDIHIYIYIERETQRERDRERETERDTHTPVCAVIYLFIYFAGPRLPNSYSILQWCQVRRTQWGERTGRFIFVCDEAYRGWA